MRRKGYSPRRKTAPTTGELVGLSALLMMITGGILVL
jgi:hypothetical protein